MGSRRFGFQFLIQFAHSFANFLARFFVRPDGWSHDMKLPGPRATRNDVRFRQSSLLCHTQALTQKWTVKEGWSLRCQGNRMNLQMTTGKNAESIQVPSIRDEDRHGRRPDQGRSRLRSSC